MSRFDDTSQFHVEDVSADMDPIMGTEDPADILYAIASDEGLSDDIRCDAAQALGVGGDNERADEVFRSLLSSRNVQTRLVAAKALNFKRMYERQVEMQRAAQEAANEPSARD